MSNTMFDDSRRDDATEGFILTRIARMLAPYAVLAAVISFLIDMSDKKTERDARAWEIVTTEAPGNSGKIDALEYLNEHHPLTVPNPRRWGIPLGPTTAPVERWARGDEATASNVPREWVLLRSYGPWKTRTPLVGIDVGQKRDPATGAWLGAPTFLENIDLRHAQLARANFTAADLAGANLSGARMWSARLTNANLEGADLTNARIRRGDFTNARLAGANFAGAVLTNADFTGADLRGAQLAEAQDLTQGQIDPACVDAKTTLPKSLRPPPPCEVTERGYLVRGPDGLPMRAGAAGAK